MSRARKNSVIRLPLALALVLTMLAACGVGGTSTSSAMPRGVVQNLVFTGPAAGTLTSAVSSCRVLGPTNQLSADFDGTMGGQKLSLGISVLKDFKGAGTYTVGGIIDGGASLTMTFGKYIGASPGGGGTMVVNADGKSGTLDADLNDAEHVRGNWECDQVARS